MDVVNKPQFGGVCVCETFFSLKSKLIISYPITLKTAGQIKAIKKFTLFFSRVIDFSLQRSASFVDLSGGLERTIEEI